MASNNYEKIVPPQDKEDDDLEEKINRRKALKKIFKFGVGTAAVMVGVKGMDELFPEEEGVKNKINKNTEQKEKDQINQSRGTEEVDNKNPDKNIEKISEQPKQVEERETERIEVNENMNAEEIAKEILRVFETKEIYKKMPADVFTSDFFIAQQFQESRYKKESKSSLGASGVYQNLSSSIIDVVKYLDTLRRKEKVDYRGPSRINHRRAEEIKKLLSKEENCGRAIGKSYLLSIYDPNYKYNQSPNKNVFIGKSPKEVQKLLMIAYHDGPSARFNPEECSKNAKNYYRSIFNFMNEIKVIRKNLSEFDFSGEEDYAVMLILRELDNYRGKEIRNKMLKKYTQLIEKKQNKYGEFSHANLKEILS